MTPRRWGGWTLAVLVGTGCAGARVDVRKERGPTLRAYTREAESFPGGVRAEVAVAWPKATLSFTRFERCPTERVEEYEELQITDRTSNGAFASLGMGVTTVLAGTGLLLALPSISDAPDQEVIDAEGRYGPSSRQWARGFGITFLVVGIPSVAAASWELSRTGERISKTLREQVTPGDEVRCSERPAGGEAVVLATRGPVLTQSTQPGPVVLTPELLKGVEVSGVSLDGVDARIDAADWERLMAFQSCAQALPLPDARELPTQETGTLRARLDAARGCEELPGAPARALIDLLEAELSSRRDHRDATPGPRIDSFEEAVATYAPRHAYPGAGASLEELVKLRGEAVLLRGTVVDFLEEDVAVLEITATRVWLYLDARQAWSTGFKVGASLEILGMVMAAQEVGPEEMPLVRVIWARPDASGS